MSTNRVMWSPSIGASTYNLERSGSGWTSIAYVPHSIPGSNYDIDEAAFFYLDAQGATTSSYRVTPVSGTVSGSTSDTFQANSSWVSSLTTAARLKEYLGLTSTTDDNLIARLVAASSRWFQSETGRDISWSIYIQNFDLTRKDVINSGVIVPEHTPLQEVISLTIDGTPCTDLTQDGDLIVLSTTVYPVAADRRNAQLIYAAGFDPVPADVEQAVIEHAAIAFRSRTRIGVLSNNVGGESVSYQTLTLPASITRVVEAWRRVPRFR